MLKLMYITNNPNVASIAQECGVDRIFVDLEFIGKDERQKGLDTVKSRHSFSDIEIIKNRLNVSKLVVRCNPIHERINNYPSSKEEIDLCIKAGADIMMLPYFKTKDEVEKFIKFVNKRCKTLLLFETKESIENMDKILSLDGIDEVFIGLNDLSLSYGQKFMFQPLADGKVDYIAQCFKKRNLPFGFGGIASIGNGMIPSEYILKEHYRLGSSSVILSRSFCNANSCKSLDEIYKIFHEEIAKIRNFENFCLKCKYDDLKNNKNIIKAFVNKIIEEQK